MFFANRETRGFHPTYPAQAGSKPGFATIAIDLAATRNVSDMSRAVAHTSVNAASQAARVDLSTWSSLHP